MFNYIDRLETKSSTGLLSQKLGQTTERLPIVILTAETIKRRLNIYVYKYIYRNNPRRKGKFVKRVNIKLTDLPIFKLFFSRMVKWYKAVTQISRTTTRNSLTVSSSKRVASSISLQIELKYIH